MFSSNNDEIDFLERMKKRDREKLKSKQKGHLPVMDRETLVQLCIDNDGYETPELNDNLFAHFKGFQKIEGLELFYNLKALWLESNGLTKIENLDCLSELRCLYLSKNLLERVENLHMLSALTTLDLSENRIKTIEGLGQLVHLSSLNVSKNEIELVSDIEALKNYKSLTNVDLSHNKLADPDILHVFAAMANLKALRLTGNDVVSKTKYFRKTYITTLPGLGYLDRPIFDMERRTAAAWKEGGAGAEEKARQDFIQHEHNERRRTLQEFRDWQNEVRAKKLEELAKRREAGEKTVSYFDVRLSPRLMAQARADSLEEKKMVAGDGITQLGRTFWAEEDARKEQNDTKDNNEEINVGSRNVVAEPAQKSSEDDKKPQAEPNTLSIDEVPVALDDILLEEETPPPMIQLEDDKTKVSTSAINSNAAPERDTWESLQRKAAEAPVIHRPPTLPSIYDTRDGDDNDENGQVKPVTRDGLWQSFTNMTQLG
ncbi:unnamed protein product [Aphanomyces euteiches]